MNNSIKNTTLFFVLIVGFALTSCASLPKRTEETPKQTFDERPEIVYDAALRAFQNLGLDVFKQEKEYIEGGRRCGFARGSEIVGIYFESISANTTIVSIDNRKQGCGMVFAVDWTDKLFVQIKYELK